MTRVKKPKRTSSDDPAAIAQFLDGSPLYELTANMTTLNKQKITVNTVISRLERRSKGSATAATINAIFVSREVAVNQLTNLSYIELPRLNRATDRPPTALQMTAS